MTPAALLKRDEVEHLERTQEACAGVLAAFDAAYPDQNEVVLDHDARLELLGGPLAPFEHELVDHELLPPMVSIGVRLEEVVAGGGHDALAAGGDAVAGPSAIAVSYCRVGSAEVGPRGFALAPLPFAAAKAGPGGVAFGDSYAMAGEGGTLILGYVDGDRYRYRVLYVGEDGILPDTWYSIDIDGKPEEWRRIKERVWTQGPSEGEEE